MSLKLASIVLLALLAFAGPAAAMGRSQSEPSGPVRVEDPWEKYVRCDRDDECLLIQGVCYGLVAVNKAFKKEAESYIARKKPAADCAPPDPSRNAVSAVCSDHRCKEVYSPARKQ